MSIVTSAASPSAPSAAAGNEVAIEKNTTVPPGAVARIAPCSQPGTSTQTTVTSAGPPAPSTAAATATGSRASARTTASARPEAASRSSSSAVGTRPTRRDAAARAGGGDGAGAAGVGREEGVGEARGGQPVLLLGGRHQADQAGRPGAARGRQGQRAALARRAEHRHDRTRPLRGPSCGAFCGTGRDDAAGEGGGAAHVHDGEGQRDGQV